MSELKDYQPIYPAEYDVESIKKFSELISNQFMHGGSKYALYGDKEFTDLVCEFQPGETGSDWILQTMIKYLGRFKNFQREKDFLKIACYCFIIYLKMGFHLHEQFTDIYNTGLETKTSNYPAFEKELSDKITSFKESYLEAIDIACEFQMGESGIDYILQEMLVKLKVFQKQKHRTILFDVGAMCYIGWVKMGFNRTDSHDEDTKKSG